MSLVQLKQVESGAAVSALVNSFYQGDISSSGTPIIAPLDAFLNIEFKTENDGHAIILDPLGVKTTYEIIVMHHNDNGGPPLTQTHYATITTDIPTNISDALYTFLTLKAQTYTKMIIHRYNADGIPERTWAVEFYGGAQNSSSGRWACVKVTPWG